MANDFDEHAANNEAHRKMDAIVHGNQHPVLRREWFTHGARWQHSLIQERLAAAEAETEHAIETINTMQNIVRKWTDPNSAMGNDLLTAFNHGAKFNHARANSFNKYLGLTDRIAQLSATCERYRSALEEISGRRIDNQWESEICKNIARKALESGERGE